MKTQRRARKGEEKVEGEGALPLWDCGSPLYDSFELASFCHVLDRHLMVLPFSKESARLSRRVCDEPDEALRRQRMVVGRRGKEEKAKKRRKMGLSAMCSAIAFCGRK